MANTATNKIASKTPKVYAYGMVNDAMATMVAQMLDVYSSMSDCIDLHVNSIGGSTFHGTAVRSCIKGCSVPVDVYIDGVAASMGGFMSLCGRKVYMSKYARIMLHEARTLDGGTSEELRANADLTDAVNNDLVAMVCERTGMTDDDVRAKFFNGKDNWITAQQAVDMKLVDGIYDLDEVNMPMAASHVEVYAILSDAHSNGVFKNKNYMEIKLPNEVVAALNLQPGYDVNAVTTGVLALAQKNNALNLELTAFRTAAAATAKNEVLALLATATTEKKITAEFKEVLASQYENNPTGLKAVLAAMPGYVSVVEQMNQNNKNREGKVAYTPQVMALMTEGYDKLDKGDKLAQLKELNEDAYLELYEQKFKCKPNESVKTRVKK